MGRDAPVMTANATAALEGGATTTTADVIADIRATLDTPEKLEAKLEDRIREVRIQTLAQEAVKRERAAQQLRLPPKRESYTLESYRAEKRPPKVARIEGFQLAGQNALLTAPYKTGKTSMTVALARSLADGCPFLGFDVNPPAGRVGVWNAEMDAEDYEGYLLSTGIKNHDAIAIWHLRGYRVDLLSDAGRDAAVEWLQTNNVAYWITDPWARLCAWSAVNESANEEVGPLLQRVHEIKNEAGISELLIVHHEGHERGRARGATVLPDDADVIWQLSRDEDDGRYLRAGGRGIADLGGSLTLADDGALHFEEISRGAARVKRAAHTVAEIVARDPGCSRGTVYAELTLSNDTKKPVVDRAIELGLIVEEKRDGKTAALYPAVQPVEPAI